jgi:hypothetical protein
MPDAELGEDSGPASQDSGPGDEIVRAEKEVFKGSPVRKLQLTTLIVRVLAVAQLFAGAVAGITPAAAAAPPGPPRPAVSFTVSGGLAAVAATSARNAWAVGQIVGVPEPKILILHWNGRTWK